jgi:hypothetical protein
MRGSVVVWYSSCKKPVPWSCSVVAAAGDSKQQDVGATANANLPAAAAPDHGTSCCLLSPSLLFASSAGGG